MLQPVSNILKPDYWVKISLLNSQYLQDGELADIKGCKLRDDLYR